MYMWYLCCEWVNVLSLLGDITGQFTTAPPTCPGDTFTFRCAVSGDINGFTVWRVNGSSECTLRHGSASSSICGPGDTFIARSGTGFGTSATSYTSTLSSSATSALSGTLVECFGPANNVRLENRVDSSTLWILGMSLLSLVPIPSPPPMFLVCKYGREKPAHTMMSSRHKVDT